MPATSFRAWPAFADAEETTEFVVFPPSAPEFRTPAAIGQVEAYLLAVFPRLTFKFAVEVDGPDGEYAFAPFMGTVGGPNSKLLGYPSAETMRHLAEALRDFRLSRGLH